MTERYKKENKEGYGAERVFDSKKDPPVYSAGRADDCGNAAWQCGGRHDRWKSFGIGGNGGYRAFHAGVANPADAGADAGYGRRGGSGCTFGV